MFGDMDPADVEKIAALADPAPTDEVACGGLRALYAAALAQPADDLALIARYDISP